MPSARGCFLAGGFRRTVRNILQPERAAVQHLKAILPEENRAVLAGRLAIVASDPNGSLDQARLGYYVRFQPGFDFVKGGKLPGLYGGTVTAGRHIPDGNPPTRPHTIFARTGATPADKVF